MTEEFSKVLEYFKGDNLASEVWYNKYPMGEEKTPKDMFRRISKEIDKKLTEIISNNKDKILQNLYLLSEKGCQVWSKILDEYESAGGKHVSYSITKNLDFSKIINGGSMLSGIGNEEELSSLSNCFVIGQPHDSFNGINYSENEMCNLEKRRGGVGIDLSSLRPKGAFVRNQSRTSSGVTLFERSFSDKNRTVAQDNRRGALMLSISSRHPDSNDFAKSKMEVGQVTGANISVKVAGNFMDMIVAEDKPVSNLYVQTFPIEAVVDERQIILKCEQGELELNKLYKQDDIYFKVIDANLMWGDIIHSAWKSAEPGILFEKNWERFGLDYGYDLFRPISTNPCAEIPMQPYDSCRLICFNIVGCVKHPFTKRAYIDKEMICDLSYVQMLIGDIIVSMEIDRINQIIELLTNSPDPPYLISQEMTLWIKIKEMAVASRRCGCGFTGLMDALIMTGFGYAPKNGEDELTSWNRTANKIDEIFADKMKYEFQCTVDMGIMFGSFSGFDSSKEENCETTQILKNLCPTTYEKMLKYGRRNISWSTAAPTGSISIMTGTTSGIEPLYSHSYTRRKKCTSDSDIIDFVDDDGESFTEYNVIHNGLILYNSIDKNISYMDSRKELERASRETLEELYKNSPYYKECAEDISYTQRIIVQGIVQKYTTHAISSTINLPEDVDEEIVSYIYKTAYQSGLKGITVYRDGSRQGVLVGLEKPKIGKRPVNVQAELHKLTYRNSTYGVCIGLINGIPYEIFILRGMSIIKDMPDVIKGIVTKRDDEYDYLSTDTECDVISLYDLNDMESNELKLLSLMLSKLLRSNHSLPSIIKLIEKARPIAGTFAFRLIKILRRFMPNAVTDQDCPKCHSKMHHQDGCIICKNCGHSVC